MVAIHHVGGQQLSFHRVMARQDPNKGGNPDRTETEWLVLGLGRGQGYGVTLNLIIPLTNHNPNPRHNHSVSVLSWFLIPSSHYQFRSHEQICQENQSTKNGRLKRRRGSCLVIEQYRYYLAPIRTRLQFAKLIDKCVNHKLSHNADGRYQLGKLSSGPDKHQRF